MWGWLIEVSGEDEVAMIDLSSDCSDLPLVRVSDGDVVMREGFPVRRLYFLKSGMVSLVRGAELIAEFEEPGTVIGEIAVLLRQPAIAEVRAHGEVEFFVAEDALAFLHGRPGVLMHIAVGLAKKVNFMAAYTADIKQQYKDQAGHLGMAAEVLDSLLNDPN